MDTGPGVLTILGSLFFKTLCDVGAVGDPAPRKGGANFAGEVFPFTSPLVPISVGGSKLFFSLALETFGRNNP